MAKIFITGSADGLGNLTASLLISQGHQVILHARNEERAQVAISKTPGAEKVLIADLANIEETKQLAKEVNALGSFDSIIHNAGVYETSNNIIFTVNTLAPYILTSLIQKPKRLIYLSSGMHLQGNSNLKNFDSNRISYSDSKLHVMLLAMAVARQWTKVYSNAVNPGWVPTKMGGSGAPDNLEKGYQTQGWLAVSNDQEAKVSGNYFFHKQPAYYLPAVDDVDLQDKLLTLCEKITEIRFPYNKT